MTSLFLALLAATAVPVAPPAEIPPEMVAHVPKDLRNYFLVFKVTPAVKKPMSEDLFFRHQAYIRSQVEQGVFHLTGPITDASGRLRGMTILTATDVEEARAIASADPAVIEKVLDIEVHPVTLPNLSTLKVEYQAR